jgi:hypothetical protein
MVQGISTMERFRRLAAAAACLVVGVASFALSYVALRDVAVEVGAVPPHLGFLVPIVVDGGVICGSAIIWSLSKSSARRPVFPFLFVGALVVISVVINTNHAGDGWLSKGIAALPPLILLGTLELVASQGRRLGQSRAERNAVSAASPVPAFGHGRPDSVDGRIDVSEPMQDHRVSVENLSPRPVSDESWPVSVGVQGAPENRAGSMGVTDTRADVVTNRDPRVDAIATSQARVDAVATSQVRAVVPESLTHPVPVVPADADAVTLLPGVSYPTASVLDPGAVDDLDAELRAITVPARSRSTVSRKPLRVRAEEPLI